MSSSQNNRPGPQQGRVLGLQGSVAKILQNPVKLATDKTLDFYYSILHNCCHAPGRDRQWPVSTCDCKTKESLLFFSHTALLSHHLSLPVVFCKLLYTVITSTSIKGFSYFVATSAPLPVASFTKLTVYAENA